jgi:hypothetical protein
MNKYLLVTILILQLFAPTTWADDYIYDRPYGGKVYDAPYGGSVIGESDSKEGAGYLLLEEGEERKTWCYESTLPLRLSKKVQIYILSGSVGLRYLQN